MSLEIKIVGILGAGQLARMSAIEAKKLGFQVYIYSQNDDQEPACEVADKTFIGSLDDSKKMIAFASHCDVVTLENEFIETSILEQVNNKCSLYPDAKSFSLIADKIIEKKSFEKAGIPVTPYQEIADFKALQEYAKDRGFPIMLKAAKGGYDGYGNFTIKSPSELEHGFDQLGGNKGSKLLVEEFIELEMEVAVQVVRSLSESKVYPVCETVQENHICVEVISPAEILEETKLQIQKYALQAVEAIGGIGIFAIEFFIDKDKKIYLNESAPRPHNSAHYTLEGCETSQFENHIRAITSLPLGSTELTHPFSVMRNILGTQNGEADYNSIYEVPENCQIHLYGKKMSRVGRKMGHLTITGDNLDLIRHQAKILEKGIGI